MNEITIVTPIYCEEKNINTFLERLTKTIEKITKEYEIIFVLDPSPDSTEEILTNISKKNKNIKIIKMSRRFGQPAATMAGIKNSKGKYVVVIDCDLQDPPELIVEMYNKIREGFDVIYAKRSSRDGETYIKKIVSKFGYRLIDFLSDIKIPPDVGDFRIITNRVAKEISNFKEHESYLRGIVSYIGFKQDFIEFKRDKRFLGEGKYNRFFGSIKIGLNGLIGFTSRPLQIMSFLGFFFSLISFSIGIIYFIAKVMGYSLTAGLPTTILAITFFSGIQLMGLGLIGEYIGRIYDEVKKRPKYIIDKKINFDDN